MRRLELFIAKSLWKLGLNDPCTWSDRAMENTVYRIPNIILVSVLAASSIFSTVVARYPR